MKLFKSLTMYECQHCKKFFKTSNRHNCRKDPEKTNCYSCIHWGHQFVMPEYFNYDKFSESWSSRGACKVNSDTAGHAFSLMRLNNWKLDCPDYKAKKQ